MLLLLLSCTTPEPEEPRTGQPEENTGDEGDGDEGTDETDEPGDTQPPEPTYSSEISALPIELRDQMTGVSWHEGCPVGLDELSLLQVSHWDMEGEVRTGQLVVASTQAKNLAGVFGQLFDARFPIRLMRPVSEYGGSDDASMAADNTSAFNCRNVTGGSSWSEHSYGHAIDINPRENPYVSGSTVEPPEGKAYVDRNPEVPGLITDGDVVVTAFTGIGWPWGGNWRSLKDYQHFSATGN